jgi:hypothetical protein
MGNTTIGEEDDFSGYKTEVQFIPYFGASYGVMSGESPIMSIGTWAAGATVSISMKYCSVWCATGSGGG